MWGVILSKILMEEENLSGISWRLLKNFINLWKIGIRNCIFVFGFWKWFRLIKVMTSSKIVFYRFLFDWERILGVVLGSFRFL